MKTTIAAAAIAVLSLSPAFALEVKKSADIPAAPDVVWKTISEFCSIGQWHPALEKCDPSMDGKKNIRTLSLKGGGTIKEERTAHSDKKMSYSYKILESPLPVQDYRSTIMVANSRAPARRTPMAGTSLSSCGYGTDNMLAPPRVARRTG